MNKVSKQLIKIAREINALNDEIDVQTQARLDEAEKAGKKYILHNIEKDLWRIQSCKDFNDVKKGEFGGYVESEENLSHDGDCWVYSGGEVYNKAQVYDNAKIYGGVVCDRAKIYGNARIGGIYGIAQVYDNAQVYGNAKIWDFVQIYGDAKIYGNADINGSAKERTKIYGTAKIYGNAFVRDGSKIHGNARVDYQVDGQEITE